jgi:Fe-S-cluster containining protein
LEIAALAIASPPFFWLNGGLVVHLKSEILSQFKCQGSGNCCRAGGYVRVTIPEIIALSERLNLTPEVFRSQFVVRLNGWEMISTPTHRPLCFLNEDHQCGVYDQRPSACRTYPDWPEIWESEATLREESRQCPGLAQAMSKVI